MAKRKTEFKKQNRNIITEGAVSKGIIGISEEKKNRGGEMFEITVIENFPK